MLFELLPRPAVQDARKRNEQRVTFQTRRFLRRFGPLNTPLSELLPVRAPHPVKRSIPFPLDGRDAHGEWLNAHHESVAPLRRALEQLAPDYDASVAFLRARPRQSSAAQQFWDAPVARAHLLNAVLARAQRSVVQVHRDCDLIDDKIYTYLPRWGCHFNKVARTVQARDAAGVSYLMHMIQANVDGSATLRLDGYDLVVTGRYVRHEGAYRLSVVLAVGERDLLRVPVAARLAHLTPHTMSRVLPPDVKSDTGVPLISRARLSAAFPESRWPVSLDAALASENDCRCAFFDHHKGACGLGNPLPPPLTGPYACHDFEAQS